MREKRVSDGAASLDRAIEEMGGKVDMRAAGEALRSMVESIRRQAERLAGVEYEKDLACGECGAVVRAALEPKALGQLMAYTTKAMDELYRLSEFAEGRADSRPEVGGSFVTELTDEQLAMVGRWLEENKARKEGSGGETLQ